MAGIGINRLGSFVPLFLVLFLTQRGDSPSTASAALTLYGIGATLGTLIGGPLIDRFGARSTIVWSMLLGGLNTVLIPWIGPHAGVLIVCALSGSAARLYYPAAVVALSAATAESRLVFTSALIRLALNIGGTAGPLLGAFIAGKSYPAVFFIDGGSSVLFALLAYVGLPAGAIPVADRARRRDRVRQHGDFAPWRNPRFLGYSLALFLIALVEIQYTAVLPLQMSSSGQSTLGYGFLVALNGALVITLEVPFTRYGPGNYRPSIPVGMLLIMIGIVAFAGGSWWWLLAGTVVWSLGEIIAAPWVTVYATVVAPASASGRYVSFAVTAQYLGFALGPALGLTVWELSHPALWPMLAIIGAIAVVVAWVCIDTPEDGSTPEGNSGPVPAADQSGPLGEGSDRSSPEPDRAAAESDSVGHPRG
jgi:predicted MFS family arabinose efflux permease